MSPQEAIDEMVGVFKAVWDGLGAEVGIPVFEDMPGGADTSKPWARVSVRHANSPQRSLADYNGKRKFTSVGTLWVQVFAPTGDGLTTARAIASAVVNAYRSARGTVWYRNPRPNEVGASGAFQQINVLVDFSYDEVI